MFKYMKKIGLSALLVLALMTGCSDGGEKQAQVHLQKAVFSPPFSALR